MNFDLFQIEAPVPSLPPFSMADLVQAWLDCRKSKRNTASALRFAQNVERNLCDLQSELLAGTYRPGRSICFVITHPKPREVWAAEFRDRIVHHLLYNAVGPRIESGLVHTTCACIKGRGTLYAAEQLEHMVRGITQNWKQPAWYLKIDLANFFVAIDKRVLKTQLHRRIKSPWWRNLADTILMHAQEPFIVQYHSAKRPGDDRTAPLDKPLPTQTTENRFAAVDVTLAPFLTEYANASGQRTFAADEPLRTQCAQVKGGHFARVTAFLAKHYTGVVGSDMADPMATVTSVDHHSLVTAHITKFNTGSVGFAADTPMHTITAGGEQARPGTAITQGIVTASMIHMGHGEGKNGGKRFSHGIRSVTEPVNTITASGAVGALVTSNLVKLRGTNVGSATDEPLHTVSARGTHHAEVRAFLIKYYGTDQDPALREPLHTVTTKDRFGLVTVHGEEYAIVDIGLRMLTPRELYRAQGFPEDYRIDTGAAGEPITKTAQVRMCGNSVCPPLSRAITQANFIESQAQRRAA